MPCSSADARLVFARADARLRAAGLPVLCDALAARGVLDDRVRAELAAGGRYWALERRICGQLGRGETPDAADVAACHESKSFDYRALHCVLHRLLGAERVPAPRAWPHC